MNDSYGRTIDYMRISITDRCNLRCKYCMPYGVERVEPRDILTLEEIQAVAMAGAGLGIRHIKVTGGEPLTRKGCCQMVRMLKAIPGIEKVTITTNGILLGRYLEELVDSGIDGINISLDTVDRDTYREITGYDGLAEVIEVLERAASLPIPIKINAVSIDFDGGWASVAELARTYPVDVRFIEMMPIGYGRNFKTLNHQELLSEMKKRYPGMEPDFRVHGFGPAVYYQIPGFQGSIGLISAIHGKFCSGCNRVRLTSRGHLKTCLCFEDGVDLRSILREEEGEDVSGSLRANGHWQWSYQSCPDDKALQQRLTAAMSQAIQLKPAAHCFENPEHITEVHNMADIGG
ncbi:MAG: GTP 3',8-cyclase MoaA [Lachnospiraceae bacterium]|nr:GTP 3',8-cyclase MoaA [Lachnospiraceae bacterium]